MVLKPLFNPFKGIRLIKVYASEDEINSFKLTRREFYLARIVGKRYWIYLINIIENKDITIFKIKDPVNKLKWKEDVVRKGRRRRKIYFSAIPRLLENNINENDLKIVSLEKRNIITKNEIKEITIKGLKALKNINNISKEEEKILEELGLIRCIEGKVMLTSSGIKLLKMIRNQKLKEIELYELLKSDVNDSFK